MVKSGNLRDCPRSQLQSSCSSAQISSWRILGPFMLVGDFPPWKRMRSSRSGTCISCSQWREWSPWSQQLIRLPYVSQVPAQSLRGEYLLGSGMISGMTWNSNTLNPLTMKPTGSLQHRTTSTGCPPVGRENLCWRPSQKSLSGRDKHLPAHARDLKSSLGTSYCSFCVFVSVFICTREFGLCPCNYEIFKDVYMSYDLSASSECSDG